MMKVVDGFASAQTAAEANGFQARLPDVEPDAFCDDSHQSAFVSRF
jgi:hypothetical protein